MITFGFIVWNDDISSQIFQKLSETNMQKCLDQKQTKNLDNLPAVTA